jgi:hypothetical protein
MRDFVPWYSLTRAYAPSKATDREPTSIESVCERAIVIPQFADMMTQFVPSLTSSAYLPAVAVKIAVPAAPPASGTTLLDAESTVCACVVFNSSDLPVFAEADGSVTTIEPA